MKWDHTQKRAERISLFPFIINVERLIAATILICTASFSIANVHSFSIGRPNIHTGSIHDKNKVTKDLDRVLTDRQTLVGPQLILLLPLFYVELYRLMQ